MPPTPGVLTCTLGKYREFCNYHWDCCSDRFMSKECRMSATSGRASRTKLAGIGRGGAASLARTGRGGRSIRAGAIRG